MNNKIATIFGGTGFLGRQIVRELAQRGIMVKVATRVPERAYFLKPCGMPGQIVPVACDYRDASSIAAAVRGSDYVVNLVGILYERSQNSFQRVHAELPGMIGAACTSEGVAALTHLSALGVDQGSSRYARSKVEGEKAVTSNYAGVTILRPSVMFGEGDDFFNKFARMARYVPFLPLIGGGHTKFQPVYVGDVADAAVTTLLDERARGGVYELGGPEVVDFKEIYARLFKYTGRSRPLVRVPFWAAKMQGGILSLLPKPPLTADQVESLKTDNIVSGHAKGFKELGVDLTGMDIILPLYLAQYRKGGRFGEVANI